MKTISFKNIPPKFPLHLTAIVYLLLDKFQPEGFVYGIVWTIVALMWLYSIIALFVENRVDVIAEIEAIKSHLKM